MQGPKSKPKYSEDAHDVSKVNTSGWSHNLTQLSPHVQRVILAPFCSCMLYIILRLLMLANSTDPGQHLHSGPV